MISIFRYKISVWDDLENKTKCGKGFVAAKSYSEAIAKLESIHTKPGSDFSEIISIDSLYEVESFDKGILEDYVIMDTFKAENN